MINRHSLVKRHNPVLNKIDTDSPLTVGNGEFAFTADITGFQTLADVYRVFPLCTMSSWGWHTEPSGGKYYTFDDLVLTDYDLNGRRLKYASLPQPGNEDVYKWLRHNPHRLNLARIALLWRGKPITGQTRSGCLLTDIHQHLDLFTGVLHSSFSLDGNRICVQTVCAQSDDVLGFSVEADPAVREMLSIEISFPYGSHKKDASNRSCPDKHTTHISREGSTIRFDRTLDKDGYCVLLSGAETFEQRGAHSFTFTARSFTVGFAGVGHHGASYPDTGYFDAAPQITSHFNAGHFDTGHFDTSHFKGNSWTFSDVLRDSIEGWQTFWNKGGAVDFSLSKDPRAAELERRAVLSQYLTAVHCAGSLPPQETGLSCNSWYGKFHLEMHILHAGWFPLWGHGNLLEKSIPWYRRILGNARVNASHNGFSGARLPKMVGPDGIDSPSTIATLLIWQQPHLIYMLDLLCISKPEGERLDFMRRHWELISETARFMCSFAHKNNQTGFYDLPPPLIPVQEVHMPETTLNPAFELGYWRFGLETAERWADAISAGTGEDLSSDRRRFREVSQKMARLPVHDGLYIAHQNCPDTFEAYNKDHPSMLYACGFIPGFDTDKETMLRTVNKVLECWDTASLWGWDYALIAMTLMRLGRFEQAIDVLLAEDSKNYCAPNGNYFQLGRDDLPLYLPGNGSLLLALAMLLEGYGESGCCLPDNGLWEVKTENILPLPR